MALPDIQSILLPLLKFAATREQIPTADAYVAMAAHFKLSAADLDVRLPSGTDRAFRNTVAWAKQHLTFARLFEPVRHGIFRATDLGRKWAQDRTQPLKLSDLRSIPGYDERRRGESPTAAVVEAPEPLATSPIERIEEAHAELRQAVIANLLDRIMQKDFVFFERLVIKLMAKLGYGDGTPESMLHTGKTGDEGIDGKIKMDKLGLDHIFLQMKRNSPDNKIDREQVAAFGGSITGARGVFVTTSTFSKQARDFMAAKHKNVVLIDGQELGKLMLRGGLGVSEKRNYVVHDLDEDFFSDEE